MEASSRKYGRAAERAEHVANARRDAAFIARVTPSPTSAVASEYHPGPEARDEIAKIATGSATYTVR